MYGLRRKIYIVRHCINQAKDDLYYLPIIPDYGLAKL